MINVPMIERAEGVVRKTINSKTTAKTICHKGHKTTCDDVGTEKILRNKLREYHAQRFHAEDPLPKVSLKVSSWVRIRSTVG
jgi:hypothetical protein